MEHSNDLVETGEEEQPDLANLRGSARADSRAGRRELEELHHYGAGPQSTTWGAPP